MKTKGLEAICRAASISLPAVALALAAAGCGKEGDKPDRTVRIAPLPARCLPPVADVPTLKPAKSQNVEVARIGDWVAPALAENIISIYIHRPDKKTISTGPIANQNGTTAIKVGRKVETTVKGAAYGEYCLVANFKEDDRGNFNPENIHSVTVYENVFKPSLEAGQKVYKPHNVYEFSMTRNNENSYDVDASGVARDDINFEDCAKLARQAIEEIGQAQAGTPITTVHPVVH